MNTLINSHAPLKKLKKEGKLQQKPWITKGIQNAIKKKNRLFKRTLNVAIVIKIFFIKQ